MSVIKNISAACAVALMAAGAGLSAPAAFAQQPATSLSALLQRVQSASRQQSAEARERESAFRSRVSEQAQLLADAEAELAALEEESAALEEQFKANDERILELDGELRAKQGDFGELFGVAKQAAGDLRSLVTNSVVSAQYPGRTDTVGALADTRRLPSRRQMDSVWKTYIDEMIRQREVVTFETEVVSRRGDTEPMPVTRLGAFNLWTTQGGTRFLQFNPAENPEAPLTILARAPSGALVGAASSVSRARPDQLVRGPLDPSRGELLGLVVDTPTLMERINQGGAPGYTILVLLAVSGAFGLFRLFQLAMVNMAVRGQIGSSRASKGNPLGRVMLAAADARSSGGGGQEVFELKLDEAIMRETSGLDFGLNFLKLAAAIAPLLGLLGTVVGMIVTFTQITLFGAGDPQIMAGGISQALVTTVMGLVAALPLLLIHSFCASFSRAAQQVIEEQGAALAAEYAESNAGGRGASV